MSLRPPHSCLGNCPAHLYPLVVCLELLVHPFFKISLTYTCIESPVDDVTIHINVDTEATVQPMDPEHSGKCGITLYAFLVHCPQHTSSFPANREQHTEGTSYQSQHRTTQPPVWFKWKLQDCKQYRWQCCIWSYVSILLTNKHAVTDSHWFQGFIGYCCRKGEDSGCSSSPRSPKDSPCSTITHPGRVLNKHGTKRWVAGIIYYWHDGKVKDQIMAIQHQEWTVSTARCQYTC